MEKPSLPFWVSSRRPSACEGDQITFRLFSSQDAYAQTMLQSVKLPTGVTNLHTGLTNVDLSNDAQESSKRAAPSHHICGQPDVRK